MPSVFNNSTRCGEAKTPLKPQPFFFARVRKQKHIDFFILLTLSTLSLTFPMFCHIFRRHLSISPRLSRSSFTRFTTKNTSWLSERWTRALKLTPASSHFHTDEIFKQHFCSFLIACQHMGCKGGKKKTDLGYNAWLESV